MHQKSKAPWQGLKKVWTGAYWGQFALLQRIYHVITGKKSEPNLPHSGPNSRTNAHLIQPLFNIINKPKSLVASVFIVKWIENMLAELKTQQAQNMPRENLFIFMML